MSAGARILVAGIGGASLGSEIVKSLVLAGRWAVFGCDISPLATGHYRADVEETFLVDPDRYVSGVLDVCRRASIVCVVPGAEAPAKILGQAAAAFEAAGIRVATNAPEVVQTCTDKAALFARLATLGVPTPRTTAVTHPERFDEVGYPCVVKPATASGGSAFVFLADTRAEAALYLRYLLDQGHAPVAQEYLPVDEGEFTVGVLSLRDGRSVGSVALRRLLHAKLSVAARTRSGVLSSGYSQGLIDEFPDVRAQAERIAAALESAGPLNVQGRVRAGTLVPFEVNARFSASTYLRALAGFNEVDLYLGALLHGETPAARALRPGHYLRDLTEIYVEDRALKCRGTP